MAYIKPHGQVLPPFIFGILILDARLTFVYFNGEQQHQKNSDD